MPDFPVLRMPAPPIITPWSLESVSGVDSPIFEITARPASATWPTANLAIFVPFMLYEQFIAVKMAIYNGAAVATDNADAGIYLPNGTKVVSSGSLATAGANAIQELDITDTTLAPGLYYMALALAGITGAIFATAPSFEHCRSSGIFTMAAAFPLPATATFAGMTVSYLPLFGVSQRSLIT